MLFTVVSVLVLAFGYYAIKALFTEPWHCSECGGLIHKATCSQHRHWPR